MHVGTIWLGQAPQHPSVILAPLPRLQGSGVPSSSEVAERLATEPEGTREDLVTKLEKRIAGLEQNLALAERAADEAGGLREALEAEAQEVAQR